MLSYFSNIHYMIPVSKGQKAVRDCTIRLLNLGHAKYEKVAIYAVNQRISNVCRIAGAASQRSNSQASIVVKMLCIKCEAIRVS